MIVKNVISMPFKNLNQLGASENQKMLQNLLLCDINLQTKILCGKHLNLKIKFIGPLFRENFFVFMYCITLLI